LKHVTASKIGSNAIFLNNRKHLFAIIICISFHFCTFVEFFHRLRCIRCSH